MQVNWKASLDAFWTFDGVKLDAAPGEKFATSYGVTEMSWDYAVEQGIVHGPMDEASVDDFRNVLKVNFWDKCDCDNLPTGIDLMVFNDATLTGTAHAAKLLQRTVGIPLDQIDGIIGPQTLEYVSKVFVTDLIEDLETADEIYLKSLRNAPLYINGWTRREKYMAVTAVKMVASQAATG